ncbi:MAG TPA: ATP-binding cassette domain-containing protein [Pyrinomonadaceae bacterium]|nr:ATP-binding cassette domain-containing protein [Pyrinomonadaceae bacterium]
MLEIRNLHASVDGNEILKGINLTVNKGEVHAIMGPNGSGKSTLAKVLAGHPQYEVTAGEVIYDGKNLLEMAPDERARRRLHGVSISNRSARRFERAVPAVGLQREAEASR